MYLGLDLGTSGLRAMLVDGSGAPVVAAERAFATQHPRSGWSEQDPAQWTDALQATAAELRASHPAEWGAVKGIGVSGHMHGATLVDAAGAVIRPCILWNDTRSHAEAAALDATPGVRELSGNIVFPGFTAPKLLWVETHEPEAFARVDKVLLPAAYVNFWLTGEAVADMSDSAGTSWLDVGARDWSDALLEAGHMTKAQMPRLVEGSEVAGTLSARAAEVLGLPQSVVVVGGAGDNAAAACGVGAMREGQAFVSLGTSGVLCAARDGFSPLAESAVHTFCHAVPGRWYQMGVILSATDSLNWLARMTGQSAAQLSGLLPATIEGPASVRFLPYLSGERTPHNDAAIRGAFTGLGQSDGPAQLTQAVMEGVAFALGDCHEALKATGAQIDRALAIGGGTASRFWLETIATVLDLPLDLPQAGEFGAALGAARLAICGVTGAAPEEVMTPPAVRDVVAPRADLRDAYAAAWDKHRASYAAIRAVQ
ncbi:xylulokinase [Mesobacterium pallidum]|uniref:xylulokinase n=1 Tax=Mesobacterium pallidum TaxID=2872037 RepID=UPI001EE33A9C|nr:xylulokinase [Mesobacterium pallidum]